MPAASHRRVAALAALAALLFTAWPSMALAKRLALLVGVGDYPHRNLVLQGPANDARSLGDVLVRRWGYDTADVVTLVDGQATRTAILQALRDLQARSAAGDELLIFFSGHGTSALDSVAALPVPHGSGAFIPVDVDVSSPERIYESVIVGRRDLRPLIEALDRGGRRVWVVADACYSGQLVRSVRLQDGASLPGRVLPLVVRAKDLAERAANLRLAAGRPATEPYPYRATAYLSAAAEGEIAKDIPASRLAMFPTLDGKPHGAMTDALLRVLEGQLPSDVNGDGLLDLHEVHRAVSDFMAGRGYGHTPQRLPAVLEDRDGLGQRPVLGARGQAATARPAPSEPLRVRVVGVDESWQRAVASVRDVRTVTSPPFDVQVQAGPAPQQVDVITSAGDRIARLGDPARLQAQVVQLAWAQALRQLAERHRRAVLPAELAPSIFGGNFREGQRVSVSVRPDRDAWVLVLNINADGKVSALYPYLPHEAAALPGARAHPIPPGDTIQVQKPYGMDYQFVFGFDSRPEGFERWVRAVDMPPDDARLSALMRLLPAMAGRFTFAATEMRTLEPAN